MKPYSIPDLIAAEQSVIACFHAQPSPALRLACAVISTVVRQAEEEAAPLQLTGSVQPAVLAF